MGAWGHGPRENDTALDMEYGLVSELVNTIMDQDGFGGGAAYYQAQAVYYAAMLCMESKTLREASSMTGNDEDPRTMGYEAFGNFVARMARRCEWTEDQVEWFAEALPVLDEAEMGGTSLWARAFREEEA